MGHPSPLWMLFMSEFWERFAFYGIRWALVLYIVAQFHGGSADRAGRCQPDVRVLSGAGVRRRDLRRLHRRQDHRLPAVDPLGAVFMAGGLFMISLPDPNIFKLGLATIVVGNGMFKPIISTIVGKLYAVERRAPRLRLHDLLHGDQCRGVPRADVDGLAGQVGVRHRRRPGLQVRVHRLRHRHAGEPGVVLHRPHAVEGHRARRRPRRRQPDARRLRRASAPSSRSRWCISCWPSAGRTCSTS